MAFTNAEIYDIECWSCQRKTNTNRYVEFSDKGGVSISILKNILKKDPVVFCGKCVEILKYNKDYGYKYRPPIVYEIPENITPCPTPCGAVKLIGRSWWKRNGYNVPCYCAWSAEKKKQETHNLCDLCVFGTYEKNRGNNAYPVSEGFCCDDCNYKKVIPARIKEQQFLDAIEQQALDAIKQKEMEEEILKNPIIEKKVFIDKTKIKLTQEKSKTKDANKVRDDKKRQRAEYELKVIEAAKALKEQEARAKMKKQQKKQQAKK